jgi:hypothetical protein
MFVVINGDLPHAYFGSNIFSITEELIKSASLISIKSGQSLFLSNSMQTCRHADMQTISVKKFFARLDGEVKTYLRCRPKRRAKTKLLGRILINI